MIAEGKKPGWFEKRFGRGPKPLLESDRVPGEPEHLEEPVEPGSKSHVDLTGGQYPEKKIKPGEQLIDLDEVPEEEKE